VSADSIARDRPFNPPNAKAVVPVTVENFIRHTRELVPIDQQTTIRTNRDTLYSGGFRSRRRAGDDLASGHPLRP
jgi:hypothetical protein